MLTGTKVVSLFMPLGAKTFVSITLPRAVDRRITLLWEGIQSWNLVEWLRVSGATSIYSSMSECLSVCLCGRFKWRVQVSGHYFVKNASFINTGGLFHCKGSQGGNQQYCIISKGTETFNLYFGHKMFVFYLYTFWPFIWLFNCIYLLIYVNFTPNYVKRSLCSIIYVGNIFVTYKPLYSHF